MNQLTNARNGEKVALLNRTPDAETRYLQSCYGLARDYPQSRHAFTRGGERREFDVTMAELSRLIEEEAREGWAYAGRVMQ